MNPAGGLLPIDLQVKGALLNAAVQLREGGVRRPYGSYEVRDHGRGEDDGRPVKVRGERDRAGEEKCH